MDEQRKAVPIRSVQRALRLLTVFGPDQPNATLSELARKTDIATSSTARLLATLEDGGFLSRDHQARYAPGPRLLQLAALAIHNVPAYEVAVRYLPELVTETGETANFGVLDAEGRVLYLHQVPSPHAIRHANWPGRTIPAAGTAIGAALTGRTGAEGYVATRKTLEPDVTAIAAPIHGPHADIVAAISVTGPTFRISDEHIATVGRALARFASTISRQLGATHNDESAHHGTNTHPSDPR